MPSPFPGMNPYLEQESVWHDFHKCFCPIVSEFLVPQIRPGLIARLNGHVYTHEVSAGRQRFIDVERLSFVEVRDRDSWELVTVVELLSPSNKYAGPDREQYVAKRSRLLNSRVHLVEIDLLRGGPRLPFEDLPECDYYAMVSRAESRPEADLWPIRLRERLPEILVPLRAPRLPARLDLQEVLHRIYDAAGYEDYIYRGQPQPRLKEDDAAWARSFVPAVPAGGGA